MFYALSEKEVLHKLNSKETGLSEKEAKKRLEKYGFNELKQTKHLSKIKIFISQFKSYLILILVVAIFISLFLKEFTDAIVISIILLLNAILGFIQEYKAEKSLEALKRLTTPKAIVLRDNKQKEIEAKYLVPGDIILLNEGSHIPADARLLNSYSLKVNESTLTGEFLPVKKIIDTLKENLILQKQTNMVFLGTSVVLGHAIAIVTTTNMETELGKIAKEVQDIESTITPLQKKLKVLSKYITFSVIFICLIILGLGYIKGLDFSILFLTAISLAVAAIPEGLPAVVTISLALGTQRMIKKNVLIRKLHSIETLGSTTIICTDKTGTITKNEMTITEIYQNNKSCKPEEAKEIMLRIAYLCNNSSLRTNSDPTEKALLYFAKNYKKEYKRLDEITFSSERKFMATINIVNNKKIFHVKGAPENILNNSQKILINNKISNLDKKSKEKILEQYNHMASKALRVLALAYSEKSEKELIFVGLVGMIDPPREEVKSAIALCKKAEIRVIMLTGDYEITAKAIANEVGINGDSLNGEDIDSLNSKELNKKLKTTNIFARVSPQHKLKILEILQSQGEIVAMTGDGVNDALTLKKANIGAAVGDGTDVAKEASDIIILDNNFNSIVEAVEEGRSIYENIKKFVLFLFSCNVGEVLILFISIFLGLPLPLIAIQLLWVNLLTDGLPALALGVDKTSKDIMSKPPRDPNEQIISKKSLFKILVQSSIITLGVLSLFYYFLGQSIVYAQTAAFSSLVFFQLFNSFNYSSVKFFRNKYLLLACLISFLLQLLVVYALNGIFKTEPLTLIHFIIILVISSSIFLTEKLFNKSASS